MTNNEIKFLKSLSQKKYRYKHKQFLAEGLRVIDEAIKSNQKPMKIWTTENFLNNHPNFQNQIIKFNYEIISETYFNQILDTKKPQHVMALLPLDLGVKLIDSPDNFFLLLDGVSDPGNMGSLLRSAVWYGVNKVICSDECVDIYNPKVVRSGMGAHFSLESIINVNLIDVIGMLKKQGYSIVAATLDGVSHQELNIKNSLWALILGNEAHGISNDLYDFIDYKVSIPPIGNIESLNVAIAGSILLDRLVYK